MEVIGLLAGWIFSLIILYLVISFAIDNSQMNRTLGEVRDLLENISRNLGDNKQDVANDLENEDLDDIPIGPEGEECPGCGTRVYPPEDEFCPCCGLRLRSKSVSKTGR